MKQLTEMKKKGQMGFGFVAIVMTIAVVAILLLVVILVFSKVGGSIPQTGFTAAENSSVANVKSTTLDAIDLVTIGLVVLAALGIIAVVMMLARAGGGGR